MLNNINEINGFVSLAEAAGGVTRELQELYCSKNYYDVSGLSTGLIALDDLTGGFQRGDLIVVAGGLGMGRTAFAINVIEYVGVCLHLPVALFSLGTTASILAQRMIGSMGRIPLQKLRSAHIEDSDWQHYAEAVARLNKMPVYIDDAPKLSVADIRDRAMSLANKTGGISLVVIDNSHLLRGSDRFKESDNYLAEMAEVSRDLKRLAHELNVPIMVITQVDYSVDLRENHRPNLSDFRGSESLENDADLVLFLYRDEVYNKNSVDKGVAEAIIAKQRNGVTGTVRLRYDPDCVRFDNLAEDASLPPELK